MLPEIRAEDGGVPTLRKEYSSADEVQPAEATLELLKRRRLTVEDFVLEGGEMLR